MKKIVLLIVCLLLLLLSFPSLWVAAQGEVPKDDAGKSSSGVSVDIGGNKVNLGVFNPTGGWGNVGALSLLGLVGQFAFVILIVVWIFLAVYAGLKYISSQGQQEGIESGTKTIRNMLVGIGIGIVFFIAVSFIGSFAGVGTVFEWADNLQECSCSKASGGADCYTYLFQAEAVYDDSDPSNYTCNEGVGWSHTP